jgi:hypothetical protein
MGSLAPILEFIFILKKCLEKGQPTTRAIEIYLQSSESSDFQLELMRVHTRLLQSKPLQELLIKSRSRLRRQLWLLIERSQQGEPILPFLQALESETLLAFEDAMTRQIQKLPFLMMIPLLLFQFPAFGLLILGPILDILFHSLK